MATQAANVPVRSGRRRQPSASAASSAAPAWRVWLVPVDFLEQHLTVSRIKAQCSNADSFHLLQCSPREMPGVTEHTEMNRPETRTQSKGRMLFQHTEDIDGLQPQLIEIKPRRREGHALNGRKFLELLPAERSDSTNRYGWRV